MAQIVVTGLAEVLADHEDKIAAAQAWCVQQKVRSIDELKSRGDAAIDAFIAAAFSSHRVGPVDAAGRVSFTGNFLEPRRDLRWSHEDENYSILEKWCGDVIYREKDVDDLPLHRLRRTVIDAERWLWPQTFRDRADFDPYYVYDPRLGCLLLAPREH